MQLPISFEFFPPRDAAGRDSLINNVAAKLAALQPEYFSVTYGAGGSTREGTRQTVLALLEAGHSAKPHLSMGTDDQATVKQLLDDYAAAGVTGIVALRGDQPSGLGSTRFANNAESLIKLIRSHCGDRFKLTVAAYPEVHPDASDAASDLEFFQSKVAAGADNAITQYFYNADAYDDFLNRCQAQGLDLPIIPGIMPITNHASLVRFSKNCGAEIPRWLDHQLAVRAADDKAVTDYGVEVVSRLCERLISAGAPALHFYTLNRWGATTRIVKNLGLA